MNRPAVLFLCVHNAGRSQMAAGWLRHLAGDTVAPKNTLTNFDLSVLSYRWTSY